jgi:hypothetical protein
MPDEPKPGADAPPPQTPNPTGTTPASGDEWKMEELPHALQEYIKGLRTEAKNTRLEKEAAEKARKAAEQAQLEEQGNWRKLAEDRAAELAKLTPYQQKAESLEKIIVDANKRMIDLIPEHKRGLIPMEYPAERLQSWLIANQAELTRKPAPDTDAGAGMGGGPKAPVVTPQTQAAAEVAKQHGYNIDPAALAARTQQIEAQRRRAPKKDEE